MTNPRKAITLLVAALAALMLAGPVTAQDPPDVVVHAGVDRYDTAAQVARARTLHPDVLYIANGESPIDAMIAGVGAPENSAILLVTRDTIPPATAATLPQITTGRVDFIGGPGVISPEVRDQVVALVGSDGP